MQALFDQDLLPRIVCGSSVGSIIASYICSRRYEDLPQVFELSQYIENPFLAYKKDGITGLIVNLVRGEPVLDTLHLKRVIRKTIGDVTFKEIHERYKWNLNITVTDERKTDEARLLNYLTTPNVVVWSAVLASSAIPGFFEPVELMIKNDFGEIMPYHPSVGLTRYIDGTIGGDLPMQRMSELFNVNTFIVSQVNPHVVPFVSHDGGGILESNIRKRFIQTLKAFLGNEVKHVVTQLCTIGVMPLPLKRMSFLITQSYKGHVTIVPQPKLKHYKNILINPTVEEYHDAIKSSYNSTLRSK